MDSTRWVAVGTKCVMWLLLELDHDMAVNDASLEKVLTQHQNLWKAEWTIETFYRPFARNIDTAYVNGDTSNMSKIQMVDLFRHAFVQISYNRNGVDPASFVRGIKQNISKTWSFKINNNIYRARQTFSKHTFIVTRKGAFQTDWQRYGVPLWHLSPDFHPHERILYRAVVKRKSPRGTVDITRLLFCRRVELSSTNFYVEEKRVALYYNRTGIFLFDNEFTEVRTSNIHRNFRICISDAMVKSAANGLVKTTNSFWLFVAVTCMFTVSNPTGDCN